MAGLEIFMALEQTRTDTLTQAIKARDARNADVVRMLKTKVQSAAPPRASRGRWTTRSCST